MSPSPISLITVALKYGAIVSAEDTTNPDIRRAYNTLQSLIRKKLEDKPRAGLLLYKYGREPERFNKQLEKVLIEVHADQEIAIIKTAQSLVTLIRAQQRAEGVYNAEISGIVNVGDQGNFKYDPPPGEPPDIPLPPKPKPKPKPNP